MTGGSENLMIRVNGGSMEWRQGLTVLGILTYFDVDASAVVVSVNDSLVPRSDYGRTTIPDGAEVKLLHLADGG